MSGANKGSGAPRAIVHKRILDVARARPDASLSELADEVSGATPDLVERVLSEYGDPGESTGGDPDVAAGGDSSGTTGGESGASAGGDTDSSAGTDSGGSTEDEPTTAVSTMGDQQMSQNGQHTDETAQSTQEETSEPTVEELTSAQLETARAVYHHPEASQGDIADLLDVSRATVSRRLNDVPGFEWTNRETFTSNLFDSTDVVPETTADDPPPSVEETSSPADADEAPEPDGLTGVSESLLRIEDRLDTVEGRLDDRGTDGTVLRPELAQKVIHAAMETDRIDEDEELELIEALLG